MTRATTLLLTALMTLGLAAGALAAPLMIVGIDEKVSFDDHGKPVFAQPGRDRVLILDLADPLAPRSLPPCR